MRRRFIALPKEATYCQANPLNRKEELCAFDDEDSRKHVLRRSAEANDTKMTDFALSRH